MKDRIEEVAIAEGVEVFATESNFPWEYKAYPSRRAEPVGEGAVPVFRWPNGFSPSYAYPRTKYQAGTRQVTLWRWMPGVHRGRGYVRNPGGIEERGEFVHLDKRVLKKILKKG